MRRLSAVETWGTSPLERTGSYPGDGLVEAPDAVLFRGVDVGAPAELVFRWLCQLRVAPYSYDRVDNLGRRSPRQLTAGLDRLEVGQRFMGIFSLVAFEERRSITLYSKTILFGDVGLTYLVKPTDPGHSRLIVKLTFAAPSGVHGPVVRRFLPAGDLLMMRKQLLTLKAMAEQDARTSPHPEPRTDMTARTMT